MLSCMLSGLSAIMARSSRQGNLQPWLQLGYRICYNLDPTHKIPNFPSTAVPLKNLNTASCNYVLPVSLLVPEDNLPANSIIQQPCNLLKHRHKWDHRTWSRSLVPNRHWAGPYKVIRLCIHFIASNLGYLLGFKVCNVYTRLSVVL